jgi:hypothetical protein
VSDLTPFYGTYLTDPDLRIRNPELWIQIWDFGGQLITVLNVNLGIFGAVESIGLASPGAPDSDPHRGYKLDPDPY